MYDHYRGAKIASLLFFPLLYITLNLILLSLFLAILLKNFYTVHDDKEGADETASSFHSLKERIGNACDKCSRRCVKKKVRPESFGSSSSAENSREY